MNLGEIIEISKKKSEEKMREAREQLRLPFFTTKNHINWNKTPRKIVVIGSGIGGMASGSLFACLGHHVNVLEMNKDYIGGHGRCLEINGLSFSMGPQYVWEFGKGELGDRFLEFTGIKNSNRFIHMKKNGFEHLFIGNRNTDPNSFFVNFKVPMGLPAFRDELIKLFPDEESVLRECFEDMILIFETFKAFFRRNSASEGRFLHATKFLLAGNVNMSIKLKLGKTIYQSLEDFFNQYGLSPVVKRILYGHSGIFAENESEMSAIAYIVGTGNYHEGAWYPENGFDHFFDSMASVIKNNNGSVEKNKKVVKLVTENDQVVKAVCQDGSEYECDAVFSDISPRLTNALFDNKQYKYEYDYSPSNSIPTCCIGLKPGCPGIEEIKGRNFWWQKGHKIDYKNPDVLKKPQMLFIASPTANGFGRKNNTDNDGLVVFCPGNFEQEKNIHEAGENSIQEYKNILAEHVTEILEQNIFPGIKDYILFTEIISSVDIQNDTAGEMGNAYGRRLSVNEVLKGPVKEEFLPSNLYNVSASKNSPGIASGIFTAELLLKELTGNKVEV
ncbi:MAG: phytoene desaturase family protein [Thermodesulfobacteriota bacterium]